MISEGYTYAATASILGVDIRTIYRWRSKKVGTSKDVLKYGPEGVYWADRYIKKHADKPGWFEAYVESQNSERVE